MGTVLDAIFERWRARLLRFCGQWLRSGHDAEEVVQDVFAGLVARGLRPGSDAEVGVLLFRSARHRCIDCMRKRRTEPLGDREPAAVPSGWSPEVREALDALPAAQREVLLLTAVDGLGYRETAAILGCSLGTVAALRFAAIEAMRRRLQP